MKRLLTAACVAAVSLGAPAVAAAKPNSTDRQQAKQTCKQLRASAGKTNFASMFGEGKKGLGRCIRRESRENAAERSQAAQQALKNAAKECDAERDMSDADFAANVSDDGNANNDTFASYYGTNGNDNGSSGQGKNAYGRCVSQHAKENRQEQAAEDRQEDQNQVNAARECRAEKNDENFATTVSNDGNAENDTFATFYGTNANHKNAFGKCVSKKAREKNDEQEQDGTSTS